MAANSARNGTGPPVRGIRRLARCGRKWPRRGGQAELTANEPTRRTGDWKRLSWPPPGCVVAYHVPNESASQPYSVTTGVIAGRPEHSTSTGRILVPVHEPADPDGAISRWVATSDILHVIPPRPSPSRANHRRPGR